MAVSAACVNSLRDEIIGNFRTPATAGGSLTKKIMEHRKPKKLPALAWLGAGLLTLASAGEEPPAVTPQLKAPVSGLEEVGVRNVRLHGGFWGPRLETHRKTTVPHVLDKLEERNHVTNFDKAAKILKSGTVRQGSGADDNPAAKALEGNAGEQGTSGPGTAKAADPSESGIVGHSAFDSDVHKALEGACHSLCQHDDPALQRRVDGILDRILAAQQDDGYLISYFIAKEPDKKWTDMRTNHEMYNAGHFFEFAVAHHQLHGDTKALDAAKRFADHIDRTFGPGKRYDVGGHQEIELALVKLYRATGEQRYLDLCRFLLDERGHAHGTERKPFTPGPFVPPARKEGLTDHEYSRVVWRAKLYWRNGRMQDHKPLLQQAEAVGHAVRAGYTYAAMADIARFSDAPEYAGAVRTLWNDVVSRKMYLTGGIGTAQYGDEGFGDPYLLPNKTYCESCASIANVLWQHRMNLMDGDAKYADVMELVLYNSAISGLSLTGDGFFYQNPLESRNGAQRPDWIGLACCPTNHARLTPQVGGMVYARKDADLRVNLYAAGTATIDMGGGKPVGLTQETEYPWDGRVKLTVKPEAPATFDLCLRIPGWTRGQPVPSDLYRGDQTNPPAVSLAVNGEPVEAAPGKDGYVRITRAWQPGDVVELNLPMPVRRIQAHENLAENRGKVALMRGPVVYCFEGIDNPDADLFQATLPRGAETTSEHRADLLGGVTTVRANGMSGGKPVKLTAIPYFAWANRGKCPMNLWIRESKDE
jgi:DUF1680 family protein